MHGHRFGYTSLGPAGLTAQLGTANMEIPNTGRSSRPQEREGHAHTHFRAGSGADGRASDCAARGRRKPSPGWRDQRLGGGRGQAAVQQRTSSAARDVTTNNIAQTTTLDANGDFALNGMMAGTYMVELVKGAAPNGQGGKVVCTAGPFTLQDSTDPGQRPDDQEGRERALQPSDGRRTTCWARRPRPESRRVLRAATRTCQPSPWRRRLSVTPTVGQRRPVRARPASARRPPTGRRDRARRTRNTRLNVPRSGSPDRG